MPKFFRRLTKRFFIICNILASLVFLIACLNAFLNPAVYWYVALLGVGFVFITVVLIGFFIFWLLFRSKWAFVPLVTLAIGWFQIHALFALNVFAGYQPQKQPGSFRVL